MDIGGDQVRVLDNRRKNENKSIYPIYIKKKKSGTSSIPE